LEVSTYEFLDRLLLGLWQGNTSQKEHVVEKNPSFHGQDTIEEREERGRKGDREEEGEGTGSHDPLQEYSPKDLKDPLPLSLIS
jgi:hypothetical protein